MLLGWMSHGSGGAATSPRICGLRSYATGSVKAGLSRPGSVLAVCASPAVAGTAKADAASADATARRCKTIETLLGTGPADRYQTREWQPTEWGTSAPRAAGDSHS